VGLSPSMAQEGASVGCDFCSSENLTVDVLRARKHCERLCGDLLAVHPRKCMLGKTETLSHRRVLE
jgi:hypothetical protein